MFVLKLQALATLICLLFNLFGGIRFAERVHKLWQKKTVQAILLAFVPILIQILIVPQDIVVSMVIVYLYVFSLGLLFAYREYKAKP